MFTSNPFADLVNVIPQSAMKTYIFLMIILVAGGTIIDMIHKQSAKFFFANAEKAKLNAKREVSGGEKVSLAVSTLTNEVLTSGEFSNPKRRISHLFTMYGFIIFVITTVMQIWASPLAADATPTASLWWHIGAAMLCFGGYWFWFFIRGTNWFAPICSFFPCLQLQHLLCCGLSIAAVTWLGCYLRYSFCQAPFFSVVCCGQNLHTCFSSLLQHFKRKSPKPMARVKICQLLMT